MFRKILKKIDLKQSVNSIDKSIVASIKKELDENGVICIKNQNLSPKELKKFISNFGTAVHLPASLLFNN
jgi:hypothetical protein